MKRSTWCIFGLFALMSSSHAVSFDCAKAKSKVEHLICDYSELSGLDDRLASRYQAALQDKAEAEEISETQKRWLKERNKCQDVACLESSYLNRINELDERWPQTETRSASYALVMSKNDEMCNHMRQLMNDDLNQFDRTYGSNDRFVSSVEEFKAIPWKPVRASYENSRKTFYTENLEGALFDLNNDGVLDFVVLDKSCCLSGMRADGLYVFDGSVASRANALTTKELFESNNQIDIAGWFYDLSAPLVGRTESLWLLSPFIYHSISYVYMQSLYRKNEAIGGDFVVIAKYFGGKFAMREMTGKMEDICYIERVATPRSR